MFQKAQKSTARGLGELALISREMRQDIDEQVTQRNAREYIQPIAP